MADQQTAKMPWTKPVIRRLEGEEAERMRALFIERYGLQEQFKIRKAN